MKLEVKNRNEETGELEFGGFLNGLEISFLLQFAINTLMAKGVEFDLQTESEELRIKIPEGSTIQ